MFKSLLIPTAPEEGATLPLVIAHNNSKSTLSGAKKVPKPSTYKTDFVLIPENLDIILLLAKNPPHVKQCNNNIYVQGEKCAILVSLIMKAYAKAEHANSLSDEGFANVSAKILQKHVQDYTEYVDFLISMGVIERDNHYIVQEKSIGYKLAVNYANAPLKEFVIINRRRNPNSGAAVRNKISIPSNDQKVTIQKYSELFRDISSVTVDDIEKAKDYIYNSLYDVAYDSTIMSMKSKRDGSYTRFKKLNHVKKQEYIAPYITRKQNNWYMSLYELDKGRAYFKQDETSFRLHTSLLSLKSNCRQFLKLQGGNIISCDIKNSQPYISAFFFTPGILDKKLLRILNKCFADIKNKDANLYKDIMKRIKKYKNGNISPSTKKFVRLVQSGEIYEYVAINLSLLHRSKREKTKEFTRAEGKNYVFKLLFTPAKYNSLDRYFFRLHFPEVAALFEDINKFFTHTKKESENLRISRSKNILAVTLQTIESYLVLDVVCKKIKDTYPSTPLLTLHDAIATNPEYEELLLEELNNTFNHLIGIPPSIKVEDWSIPN
jgi:hypothetical protein